VSPQATQALTALLARQRSRVVAHLARALGLAHLALAEDAVQSAALRAIETWPADGVPQNPAGWLYRVAHNWALDQLRQQGRHQPLPEADEDQSALPSQPAGEGRFAGELHDDELALLFAACHPQLPSTGQVSLALHMFTALPHASLAAALLCSEAALAQRLQRARETLGAMAQPLRLPAGHELPARREAVLTVLALGFHAGARARGRQQPSGLPLCWESMRLARTLAAHPVAGSASAHALAAMLLLHGARLSGQVDDAGHMVLLAGQPRDRWDQGLVKLGMLHLQAAQGANALSRWHLLAGIAAEHAMAPTYAATDWAAILRFYDALLLLDNSAAPLLSHAIALAESGAPQAALQRLQALLPGVPTALRAHTLAALARVHERLGDLDRARAFMRQAMDQAPHEADARLLSQRLAAWG
jgi:RNA polymerase sigma-70 factor, ECF subfamily